MTLIYCCSKIRSGRHTVLRERSKHCMAIIGPAQAHAVMPVPGPRTLWSGHLCLCDTVVVTASTSEPSLHPHPRPPPNTPHIPSQSPMAGADLERVVELLRSEDMDEQFRLLGAGTLLSELRSSVSSVYSSVTNSTGANLRLLFCIQSLAAPMRELLVAVLHSKIRSERWRQVLASLFSNGFSRSNTLRDLREYSRKFRALASYLNQAHIQVSTTASASMAL